MEFILFTVTQLMTCSNDKMTSLITDVFVELAADGTVSVPITTSGAEISVTFIFAKFYFHVYPLNRELC